MIRKSGIALVAIVFSGLATAETWKRHQHGLSLTVTLDGTGPACSAPLEIALTPCDTTGLTWWAPWANPEPGPSCFVDTGLLTEGQINDGSWKKVKPGVYGAYGAVTTQLDPDAGFRLGVLWRTFDFPYIGMFLPPVADNESWTTWDKRTLDVPTWRAQQRELAAMGIASLDYFNVAEYGARMFLKEAEAPANAAPWHHMTGYLREHFPRGTLTPWSPKSPGRVSPAVGRTCLQSWEGCLAMDLGDPAWRKFLIEQAKAHVERIPESAGIAIDRFDWMRLYSPDGDDGVSWVEGRAARSVGLSWCTPGADLGAVFHPAGKVIMANNHTNRIDYLRDVDGVLCESRSSSRNQPSAWPKGPS
jgi:hypothetical protein